MTNKKPPNAFVKGDPRINRKGRKPLGTTFGDYVRAFIEAEDEGGKKKAIVEEMMTVAIRRAKAGSFQHWDAIINRAYGKVPDKVEMNTQEKPDLSKLTQEELTEWIRLLQKARSSQ